MPFVYKLEDLRNNTKAGQAWGKNIPDVVWGDVKGGSRCAAALGSLQREGELGGGVRGKRSPTVI